MAENILFFKRIYSLQFLNQMGGGILKALSLKLKKMPHIRIKFTNAKEREEEDLPNGWHLLSDEIGDGEYTACGMATPEYDTKEEEKDKGGITCPECLKTIKFYKGIKL